MRETEARSSRKNQSRAAPAVAVGTVGQTTGLAGFTFGLLLASGAKSIDGLAARLGDEQMLSIQRQALATGIGNLQGNQHLQRVIGAARQTAPAYQVSNRAIQRSALSEAQTRAGTPSSGWAQLSGPQLREMADLVRAAEPTGADQQRQQALERLAALLGLAIPGAMSLEVTPDLGLVQGVTSERAAAGDGMFTPYVIAAAQCPAEQATGAPPHPPDVQARHRSLHTPADFHFAIQVNPRVFREGTLLDRIFKLHSTLMHEYTHYLQFQQEMSGGIHSDTIFIRRGNVEFLGLLPSVGEQVSPLQEIDATCSEIENAAATRLQYSSEIRHVANYLWTNFRDLGTSHATPDIINRVYDNIHRARGMLINYIENGAPSRPDMGKRDIAYFVASSPGITPRYVMLEHWLSRCPQDFTPSPNPPGVNDPAVLGRISAQITRESAFRSGPNIARLEADIRAIAQTIRSRS
ncbi:MAG: hypothetical protein JXA78_11825 [Anaerolineales bacterium]|nr:hypothetical protein [Anaerolineales bacterium]